MTTKTASSPIWRRNVLAWCCYDWANSGYTTLMITVFALFMQKTVYSPETSGSTGAVVWAWSVAVSMLLGALLAPVAGALADARAGKRTGLALTALGGATSCMLMAIVPPEYTWLSTGCFVAANLCLELSLTFYNGFLPEVAKENEMNRVSAVGMAWGYVGGGLALLLAMVLLNFGGSVGLNDPVQLLRICIFATGVWWLLFSFPTIYYLRDTPRPVSPSRWNDDVANAFSEVFKTIREFRHQRTLLGFLVGFLFYNDGVQTVISQASTFAIQELSFTGRELVAVILMVQLVATPGALLTGWLSDWLGRKRVLIGCLLVWIGLLTAAWFVESKTAYWALSIGVAIVLGGTQAVSRAIMASLTPENQEARYFGFFNLSGKATSFMGTFVFGFVIVITGSSRIAIVGLLAFFVIGLSFISLLDLRSQDGS